MAAHDALLRQMHWHRCHSLRVLRPEGRGRRGDAVLPSLLPSEASDSGFFLQIGVPRMHMKPFYPHVLDWFPSSMSMAPQWCNLHIFLSKNTSRAVTSDRLATTGPHLSPYHVHPLEAHTMLAQASLSVLLGLDRVDKNSMKHFPLAIYAARHWVAHAQFENVSACIEDAMEHLLTQKGHTSQHESGYTTSTILSGSICSRAK